MRLGTSTKFIKISRKTGIIQTNLFNKDNQMETITEENKKLVTNTIYKIFNKYSIEDGKKLILANSAIDYINEYYPDLNVEHITYVNPSQEFTNTPVEEKISTSARPEIDKTKIKNTLKKFIDFFSEFSFEPNYRFVNTFSYCNTISEAIEYTTRYFELSDSPYTNSIIEKMKSPEFKEIALELVNITPSTKINTRFKLYYGSAGTGKTTAAMKEADGNCMVCHSAMLPSDLMEDFKFEEGKAAFQPSSLYKAITEGKKIVLDEINLLPFESLRFLQSILDGKKEFNYKGINVQIKDGFQIIGTMNLNVNGSVYSLPEPLVDRAEQIKKYTLTADNLLNAIC
jgi:hypothetical protein